MAIEGGQGCSGRIKCRGKDRTTVRERSKTSDMSWKVSTFSSRSSRDRENISPRVVVADASDVLPHVCAVLVPVVPVLVPVHRKSSGKAYLA